MKGILAAIVLVLLAVLAGWILHDGGPEERPDRPDSVPPEDVRQPEPPAPIPDEPPISVEPGPAGKRVQVHTNVAGASVTLHIHLYGGGADPEPREVTADADGNAEFAVPETPEPVSAMVVTARASGYSRASARVAGGEARLTLVSGVPISGIILDRARAPVADAMVSVGDGESRMSDATGAFEVWALDAGPVELRVRHSAYRDNTFEITAPDEKVEIFLDRGQTVSGRVSFPDGKPVPEIGLQTSNHNATASTGDDGRYVLSGFVRGTVTVRCRAARDDRDVEVGASEINFVVSDHVVRMRFTDEEGRPFRRANLWVRGYLGEEDILTLVGSSGEHGLLQLDRVRTGVELRISPSAPGYGEEITRVSIDGEPRLHEVEVILAREGPKGSLELRVLDDVGDPRRHATVSLSNDAGSPVQGYYGKKVELNEEGRCRVEVPPGRYELTIADSDAIAGVEGYALASTREIEVIAGESLPVEAVVDTGGRIGLTVTDAAGETVAVGRVRLLDPEGRRVMVWFIRIVDKGWTTDLDEPGPALLGQPVAPGRYLLRLEREGETIAEREVDVEPGRTTEVTIQLPR